MSKCSLLSAIILTTGLLSNQAFAALQTITLYVPGMNCPVCPITVKKSLGKVAGVTKVEVSYETKQAVVTYDDSKTSPETLQKATRDAGYPSSVVKEVK